VRQKARTSYQRVIHTDDGDVCYRFLTIARR